MQLLPHSYKRCQIFSSLVTSQAHPDLNIGEALCINIYIFLFLKFPSLCMEWFRLFLVAWPWKLPKGVKELQNHGISNLTTLNKLSCTYPCSVKPQWKTSWCNHLKWYYDKLLRALLPWNRTFALMCSWQVTSEYLKCVQCATHATLIQEVSEVFHHWWLYLLSLLRFLQKELRPTVLALIGHK